MSTDLNKVVKAFRNIRAERSRIAKEARIKDAELKEKLETLQNFMLSILNENNAKRMATDEGTFFKKKKVIPTGADWNAFYKWVAQEDAFDFLERRIKASSVKVYMEEHKGEPPPGVNVFEQFVVGVRKGTSANLPGDDDDEDEDE
jgi:hypothetical protein